MKSILSMAIIIAVSFTSCQNSNSKTQKADTIKNQKKIDMKNLISIVEIPVTDFSKAVTFYQTILELTIEEMDMDGTKMGVFPSDGKTVNVVLVKGIDYKPSTVGTLVYLNAGKDLQITLDKVEKNGGKIVVPKTEISPEMGFFAIFTDTEGNKLGLHSSN
jgi:uncharacterized protein